MAITRRQERFREGLVAWLADHPGRTALEISRAYLRRDGPNQRARAGQLLSILYRMESAGLLRHELEAGHPFQGDRLVKVWYTNKEGQS